MAVKKAVRRRERREMVRVDARLSMRVEGAHDGAQAQVVTESQNISSSGVYCLSSHYLPPLSKVQLTIVLPRIPGARATQELLKCEGIVVRCEPASGKRAEPRYQLACMFSGLGTDYQERLEEFVTWRNLQSLRAAVSARSRTTRTPAAKPARARTRPAARAGAARKVARKPGTRRAAR